MDFKYLMILVYFNSVAASYSYNEIKVNFGLVGHQLYEILDNLEFEGYIELNEYYKLTIKGLQCLEENNLLDVDYFLSFDKRSIFEKEPITFDDIYIPIGFTKKMR